MTSSVAEWLEHPPREREVMGSILGHDRPKSSIKTGSACSGFPPWIMGLALRHARQCQDNGLVKYWLKVDQETWICELSLLNN